MAKSEQKIYTVSQITAAVKDALEKELPSRLLVAGEISDWKVHHSGHCYFILKDKKAQLPCAMWASKFKNVKFEPENGMAVLAGGYIDVYPPQGKYQLYVDKLQPQGIGALQLAFEQMVKRLEAEGLFKPEHKKPIPSYPMRIAMITSETGAAVHDIADSIYNRWPCAKLFLYPAAVQGEGAAEQIAKAIRTINKRNSELKIDVLIVGRGGGSLEDLWAFNEEVTARAIFASSIPVISAVGHEVDVTIADLVADARASTPTKAGVIAVPQMSEVLERIDNARHRLDSKLRTKLELAGQNLETILASAVFRNPHWVVNVSAQRIDELSMRLIDCARGFFKFLYERLQAALEAIARIEPAKVLAHKMVRLNDVQNSADSALTKVIAERKIRLTAAENRLKALNPRSVLGRGYSITTNKKTGKVIIKKDDVQVGDTMVTELADRNFIESQVRIK